MKGFKPVNKSFNFKTSADIGAPKVPATGQKLIPAHFRKAPAAKPVFAKGGRVGGNAAVQRSQPVTDFDAAHGGKGPLRTGYAKGGKTSC